MARCCIAAGALLMMLAVVAGAVGAHALAPGFDGQRGEWFEKAVFYHFIHALGLIGIGCASSAIGPSRMLLASAVTMGFGICGFSGSLYLLALTPFDWARALTPIGGGAYIVGWLLLGTAALRGSTRNGTCE